MQGGTGGLTANGACDNTKAETASRVLRVCEDSAELMFLSLGKHFMEPGSYDKIPL
jgi:hypothetical protein